MSGNLIEHIVRTEQGAKEFAREGLIVDVTERICELMKEQKVSRTQLAERLGITKGRVSQLLDGTANMTLRTLSDIFLALGRSVHVRDKEVSESITVNEPMQIHYRVPWRAPAVYRGQLQAACIPRLGEAERIDAA